MLPLKQSNVRTTANVKDSMYEYTMKSPPPLIQAPVGGGGGVGGKIGGGNTKKYKKKPLTY